MKQLDSNQQSGVGMRPIGWLLLIGLFERQPGPLEPSWYLEPGTESIGDTARLAGRSLTVALVESIDFRSLTISNNFVCVHLDAVSRPSLRQPDRRNGFGVCVVRSEITVV